TIDDGRAGIYPLGAGCGYSPTAFASATAVSTAGLAECYYSFDQTDPFWTAVGVRGSSDWNLDGFQNSGGGAFPSCFSVPLASSGLASPAGDFILPNFNNQVPTPPHYLRPPLNHPQPPATPPAPLH